MTKILSTIGFRNRGDWAANTFYRKDDRVKVGRGWMYATRDHDSSEDFDTDRNGGKWDWLVNAEGLEDIESAVSQSAQDHLKAVEDSERALEDHLRAEEDHGTASSDHNLALEDHETSDEKSAYANEQGDRAKTLADHPAYIADGTEERPGDANYWYVYNLETEQYEKDAYAKGDDLHYEDMTDEEKEALAEKVLDAISVASVSTSESIIDELD